MCSVHLYGFNQRTYEPRYLSYVNTVYFSTIGNPALNPTTSPALTPAPTLYLSNLTISNLLPSPTIPEFPSVIIVTIVLIAATTTILFYKRTRVRGR